MRPRRALFFAWPIGAGHTGRSLVVARFLRRVGCECSFAADPTGEWVAREGFAVAEGSATRDRLRARVPSAGYMVIPSLDAAFAAAGCYHAGRVDAQVAADLETIRRVRPSLVVTHMHPTAVVAAEIERIPILSIAEADFLDPAPNAWMPWADPAHLAKLVPFPPSLPAFNAVRAAHGLAPIVDVTDLLCAGLVILASGEALEPLHAARRSNGNVRCVGPLIWDPDDGRLGERLADFGADRRPRVYVTLGSGEMTPARTAEIAHVLAEYGCAVLLSAGYASRWIARDSASILVHAFGGLRAGLRWADVVVSR